MGVTEYNANSYGIANQLVGLQSAIGIDGGTYVTSPSVGYATYPYAPPSIAGQPTGPSGPVVSPASGGAALAGMTRQQANAVQGNPLTNPVQSPVVPTLIMLIVGIVILDLFFFRKKKMGPWIDNPLVLGIAVVFVAIGGSAVVTYFTHTPIPGVAIASRQSG